MKIFYKLLGSLCTRFFQFYKIPHFRTFSFASPKQSSSFVILYIAFFLFFSVSFQYFLHTNTLMRVYVCIYKLFALPVFTVFTSSLTQKFPCLGKREEKKQPNNFRNRKYNNKVTLFALALCFCFYLIEFQKVSVCE